MEQPDLVILVYNLLREPLLAIQFGGDRRNLALGELAHQFSQSLLLLSQREINHFSLCLQMIFLVCSNPLRGQSDLAKDDPVLSQELDHLAIESLRRLNRRNMSNAWIT